jgi:preprotein translocase subunit SecF
MFYTIFVPKIFQKKPLRYFYITTPDAGSTMHAERHRRILREQREKRGERKPEVAAPVARPQGYNKIYHDHYKKLLFITFGILLISLLIIAHTYIKTGDIFYKGVSLSGGMTMSIATADVPVDVRSVEGRLRTQFPESDITLREISDLGKQQGITIEAITPDNSRESLDTLAQQIYAALPEIPTVAARASTEITGPSLGESFFKQTLKAVLIAFVSMGLVVFLYFGDKLQHKIETTTLSIAEAAFIWYADGPIMIILAVLGAAALLFLYIKYSIPSTAVILAAFSTITFTIAVVDLMEMRISTAGIAAFLMLIGYSVDTDILLSTRVLKSSVGTVYERIVGTIKTGVTMTGTTFVACLIALIFAQSAVIREIMTIIAIGIIADVFYTWVQNSGILRMYLESKGRSSDSA